MSESLDRKGNRSSLINIKGKGKGENINNKERPRSADPNLNKRYGCLLFIFRVSVSGLVSYKFKSINAKKSLGFNPGFDKEEMLIK